MEECVFCKIRDRKIPKEFTYEDEDIMVFPDIHPVNATHLLIVPKKHIETFSHLEDDVLLGKIRKTLQSMIQQTGLEGKGYRITANGGGAQVINHLHFHLTGPWGLHAAL